MGILYLGNQKVTPFVYKEISSSGLLSYTIENGTLSKNTSQLTGTEFSGVTSVADYGLYYAFAECDFTGRINMASLTNAGDYALYDCFTQCGGITSVDFSSLQTAGNNCFLGCFKQCTGLTEISFPALTTVGTGTFSSAFSSCTSLTTARFPALSSCTSSKPFGSCFSGCTALQDIYFNALTTTSFGTNVNQFSAMFSSTGSDTTHTIHFPSNLESTIQGLTGYPLFGGTSGYVVLSFDLPATE